MSLLKNRKSLIVSAICWLPLALCAELSLPNVFGDHMVLQRDQVNPVWGTGEVGEAVTVTIREQSHRTVVGADGQWRVELDPLAVGAPTVLTVEGQNRIDFEDVLVGEVWICSGQSNMNFALIKTDQGDLDMATANCPELRMLRVPNKGTPVPQDNFEGAWKIATPHSVKYFSAIGYLFANRIHRALEVPVGIIDNSWSGAAAEAWVPREVLEAAGGFERTLADIDKKVAAYTDEMHTEAMAAYKQWRANGKPAPHQREPRDYRYGNARAGNIFNGMLYPILGYGIRGVIWYQGESNGGRGEEYGRLFPLLITNWRNAWQQGDFPFYWSQLADFGPTSGPKSGDGWATLRESQSMTLSLPNTGEAVILDAGEGRDIHPRNKALVADRLARIALARDYGFDLKYESPRFASLSAQDGALLVSFDAVSSKGLYAFDDATVLGFTLAGADGRFIEAEATIVGKDQVKVSSPLIADPVAVRYGWANNPIVNLQDKQNALPVTPFRATIAK